MEYFEIKEGEKVSLARRIIREVIIGRERLLMHYVIMEIQKGKIANFPLVYVC